MCLKKRFFEGKLPSGSGIEIPHLPHLNHPFRKILRRYCIKECSEYIILAIRLTGQV